MNSVRKLFPLLLGISLVFPADSDGAGRVVRGAGHVGRRRAAFGVHG